MVRDKEIKKKMIYFGASTTFAYINLKLKE